MLNNFDALRIHCNVWEAPADGWVKINSDGAINDYGDLVVKINSDGAISDYGDLVVVVKLFGYF